MSKKKIISIIFTPLCFYISQPDNSLVHYPVTFHIKLYFQTQYSTPESNIDKHSLYRYIHNVLNTRIHQDFLRIRYTLNIN
jgi:hypothetical protein